MNPRRLSKIVLILATGLLLSLNHSSPRAAATGKIQIPVKGSYFGAYLEAYVNDSWTIGSWGPAGQFGKAATDFEASVGKKLAVRNVYSSWNENWHDCFWYSCFSMMMQTIVADGSVPMVSWRVGWWTGTTDRPPLRLQEIIDGGYDDYLIDWAREAKAFKYPVFLRFGWEMNTERPSYSGAQNFGKYGNQSWDKADDLYKYYGDPQKPDGPERYVDAWKHAHDIFRRVGADNVEWVWCPHGDGMDAEVTWNYAENYYPGDDYVDWVGSQVFNLGYWIIDSGVSPQWRAIDWFFENSEVGRIYKEHPSKPFMIAEISSSMEKAPGVPGDKAGWIADAASKIKNKYQNVKALVWFSEDVRQRYPSPSERDWRLDYPPDVLSALKYAMADSYFLDHIPFEYYATTSASYVKSINQEGTINTSTAQTSNYSMPSFSEVGFTGLISIGVVAGFGIAAALLIAILRRRKV